MGLRKILLFSALTASLLVFPGCGKTQQAPVQATAPTQATEDPALHAEDLTMVVTYENVGQLENYKNLKRLDATGSTCYPALEVFARNHPNILVSYTVSLGKVEVPHGIEEIRLSAEDTDFETLQTNLQYLKDTKYLRLPKTSLTAEELDTLAEKYPDLEITYTLGLAGKE